MTDHLRRVEDLYHAALARPSDARAAFLADACADDEDLRREVESLVAQATGGDSVFAPALTATADTALTGVTPGDRLGPYTVIEFIGRGGMGEVYRARDPRLQRDVAIKVLRGADTDPNRQRRLLTEARAAGALNHPNILVVYDVGVFKGSPFVVSELLVGETLRHVLARGALDRSQALDLAMQIAQGCAVAHARGIVHRDLKPENLFVTSDGRLKILDFGLARRTSVAAAADAGAAGIDLSTDGTTHLGNSPSREAIGPASIAHTQAGQVMGTAGYMAPEQVRGERADHRADIFALGAILYEMVTGRRAFGRPSTIEAMQAVLTDEPGELSAADARVPSDLAAVIRRCLKKPPEDRFQSAKDVVSALAALQRGLRDAVPDAVSAKRRRWQAGIGMAALVGTLALGAVLLVSDRNNASGSRLGAQIKAIAVLPLKSDSKEVEEYLADGMTEALIADLGGLDGVRVISRTSSMTYKSVSKSLTMIADELKVDAVVEGSVAREGSRIRITVRLLDARTERQLWNHIYERDFRDVLALQGEVARAVADEVRGVVTPQLRARLTAERPVDPRAQEMYMRGRYFLKKGTEADIKRAKEDFTEATRIDSDYAAPYAGLSDAYTALRSVYLSPHDVMPQAKAAARKALQLDPDLTDAHVSMGAVLMYYDFDWVGAEAEFRRAIDLSPNHAVAHDYYALYLAAVGRREEAKREAARARDLDPLSPPLLVDTAFVYFLARDVDQSVALNRQAIDLDSNFWPAHRDLGLSLEHRGQFPEAIASLQKARQIDTNSTVLEMLAGAYAAWGKTADARRVLNELTDMAGRQYVCPYEVATVHSGLGDTKATLDWLEKGYRDRADCMPWMYADPKLDSLHGHPQFQSLLKRMGLPLK